MYYIQRKDQYNLETVDETNNLKDAQYLLNEYSLSDPYGSYYMSRRPCKEWTKQ